MIIIFEGATASGKSVVSKALIEKFDYRELISYTNREKRPGEVHGKDYYFVDKDVFLSMIEDGKFAEHERYPGERFYGTSLADVKRAAESDKLYVMALTPSGRRNIIREVGKENVVTVLIERNLGERVKSYIDRCKGNFTLEDLDELCKRGHRDFGMLMGCDKEADIVVENDDISLSEITYAVHLAIQNTVAELKLHRTLSEKQELDEVDR